jgi:hypothetical protein
MVLLLMPRFFFDLFYDRYVILESGGMLFERKAGARAAAGLFLRPGRTRALRGLFTTHRAPAEAKSGTGAGRNGQYRPLMRDD